MTVGKIRKILIANRGEIACRVIRTARRLGIQTVAVYSDADRKALHVRMADEAVRIGPGPAAESYLVIDNILRAARQTRADAVHPGYGFLSENPDLARSLGQADIIFVGPTAESMEAMGRKDAAKILMEKAGVPVTPGYHGKAQDVKTLAGEAAKTGYPVLIKAVAGGGGKGMSKVEKAGDFRDVLASCRRQAKAAFGDDRVLIEKYIRSPRHIEVQVFGDMHGQVVHMFERDCSLQRRHQKVIEEAPAPGMTAEVRAAVTGAAVQAARAVDYVGAGTVEFIADGSGQLRPDGFWFMEMNTRLQVEHPVTEMITKLDLVELQIRVAEGKKLPRQKDLRMSGHAIEARLYAEDPANDFLPSVGTLEWFQLPQTVARIDTGVERGDGISMFYDPMIAKMIGFGGNRDEALENLRLGCANTSVFPPKTNAAFLQACLETGAFRDGDVSTGFIADHMDTLVKPRALQTDLPALSRVLSPKPCPAATPFGTCDGWRVNLPPRDHGFYILNGEMIKIPYSTETGSSGSVAKTVHLPEGKLVCVGNRTYLVTGRQDNELATTTGNSLAAPMPGRIIRINVKPGDTVGKGDTLVVMEAMKMEMSLQAPRDGVISGIMTVAGALVNDGDMLLHLQDT